MMIRVNGILRWATLIAIPLLGAMSCAPAPPSDRRLKRNIAKVGVPDGDIDLYRYQYLWSDEEYVGVMAQDLLGIRPDAVVQRDDGYLAVDYAKLGTKLQTWKEWRSAY
jgi:hypothetical protein